MTSTTGGMTTGGTGAMIVTAVVTEIMIAAVTTTEMTDTGIVTEGSEIEIGGYCSFSGGE